MSVLSRITMRVVFIAFTSPVFASASDFCELYPITLPGSLLEGQAEGQVYSQVPLGNGQGNFSWLTWSGRNDANTFANSLIPPGDSNIYVHPYDNDDTLIEEKDWVQGAPGVKNGNTVRQNLAALVGRDIIVPTWSLHQSQGANFNYQVYKFAVIEITDYKLNGKGWLSFTYKGFTQCYNESAVAQDSHYQTLEGTAVIATAYATDTDGDILRYAVLQQPQHGSLSGIGPNFTYTPQPNFNGSDSFTFVANDGEADSNIGTVSITVSPVNDVPMAFGQQLTLNEDDAVAVILTGTDVDGDSLSFTIVAPPQHGTIAGEGYNWVYQAAGDFFGEDSLQFIVSDGALNSEPALISFTVSPVNDAPTVSDIYAETYQELSVELLLSAVDPDNDAVSFALISAPAQGTTVITGNSLQYTPAAGFIGQDSFTYQADDGELGSNIATITVNVLETNKAPQITSLPSWSAIEAVDYQYDIAAQDPNTHDVLTYQLLQQPIAATIDNQTGALRWIPDAQYAAAINQSNPYCAISRALDQNNTQMTDIVVAVDESGSMSGEHEWIAELIPLLEAHLFSNNIGNTQEQNKYSLVGFGGSNRQINVGPSAFGSAAEFVTAAKVLSSSRGGIEDGWSALKFGLNTPLRESSARNVILITDEDRDNTDSSISFDSIKSDLQAVNAILNIAVDANFVCGDGQTRALGLGQNGIGYVADGSGGYTLCSGVTVTKAFGTTVADYVELALSLEGAAWDLNVLRAGGLDAQSFSKAFVAIKVQEIKRQFEAVPQPDIALTSLQYINQQAVVNILNTSSLDITSTVSVVITDSQQRLGSVELNGVAAGQQLSLAIPLHTGPGSDLVATATLTDTSLSECSVSNNQLIAALFNAEVSDSQGLTDNQLFALSAVATNTAPQIVSEPVTTAAIDTLYAYQVVAQDTDRGDAVVFKLLQGPTGMTLDEISGRFDFRPNASQAGLHQIVIQATDLTGATAEQQFELQIDGSYIAPKFSSFPALRAIQSSLYFYQAEAVYDATASISYQLLFGPAGMSLDALSGELQWQVPENIKGKRYQVILQVKDQLGNYDIQSYILTGDIAPVAPVLTEANINLANQNANFSHTFAASDANALDIKTWQLVQGPANSQINSDSGVFSWQPANISLPGNLDYFNPTCFSDESVLRNLEVAALWSLGNINMTQPLVAPLYDTNQDGLLTAADQSMLVGINSNRHIFALNARTGEQLWQRTDLGPHRYNVGAIVNLDNDSNAEFVFVQENTGKLIALNSDGSTRWVSAQPVADVSYSYYSYSGVYPADIDDDGVPELIFGPSIFNAAGEKLWHFTLPSQTSTQQSAKGNTLVVDMDLDGQHEVVYFNEVRSHSGQLLWKLPESTPQRLLYISYLAYGNFDSDDNPELVVSEYTSRGRFIKLIDHTGELLWEKAVSRFGPLNIADFNHDGMLEIYSASNDSLYNGQTGAVLWSNGMQADYFGAMVADLDMDGWLDIVRYRSDSRMSVHKAATGELSTVLPYGYASLTPQGAPVFVDVDADGHAELVTGGTQVRVYKPRHGNWLNADSSYAYLHQTKGAVSSDVKPVMTPLPYYALSGEPAPEQVEDGRIADLSVSHIRARPLGTKIEVTYAVRNRGTTASTAGSKLLFFADVIDNITKIAEADLPVLAINETHTATLHIENETQLGQLLVAHLQQAELHNCNVDNDTAAASVVRVQVTDADNLSDNAFWAIGVRQTNLTAPVSVVAGATAVVGTLYQAQVNATDPNPDDLVRYYLQTAPTGAMLDSVSGELTWVPQPHQVGRQSFVVITQDLAFSGQSKSFSVTVNAPADANVAPRFTSAPVIFASVGYPYYYDVKAEDTANDILRFSLQQAPEGMVINAVSGEISWLPIESQLGDVAVSIKVTDLAGAADLQQFVISTKTNALPVITSTAVQQVVYGNTYQYDVNATDADGDNIIFSLTAAPEGMTIDATTGQILWSSLGRALGTHLVVVRAADSLGAYSEQRFAVTVQPRHNDNAPPFILSHPVGQAVISAEYSYQVVSQDSDNDSLSYLLTQAPLGMVIDSQSGLLQWPASDVNLGEHAIALQVEDGRGGLASQAYQLIVTDGSAVNSLPVISSVPALSAKAGYQYRYNVLATDADADALTYQLTQAPAGMTLTSAGELSWLPDTAQWAEVKLRVSDGTGYVEQGWSVRVSALDASLSAQIEIIPGYVYENEQITIRVKPVNAVAPLTVDLQVDGQPVALDANYSAEIIATGLGLHRVEVSLADAYESAQISSSFVVRDPNETPVASLAIVSPQEAAVVGAPTEVVINVDDANVVRWQLMYAERGSQGSSYQLLAEGAAPVVRQAVASFDPSLLHNGLYQLVLQATYQDGSTAQQQVTVSVEGNLKVGNYSVSFEDVNIAVAGMPVIVSRTYDSRDKAKSLDFGHGWRVDYQAMRIQESRILGRGWRVNEYPSGFFSNWCVEPDGNPIVAIVLPDGRIEKFKAKANPHCQQIVPAVDVRLEFEALPGTSSSLKQQSYGMLRVNAGELIDLMEPGSEVDPSKYQLTTVDGYVFNLNQSFGIDSIITPTGHTVSYSKNGVIHSGGLSITFERDAQDRITHIVLPDSSVIEYEYDAAGDLIAHHDVLQQATRFGYDSQHSLLDIVGANGVAMLRNEYDDAGRLIAQTDAAGNRLEFTHDLDSNRQVINDRRGNRKVFTYDDMGNVLNETNALGETISRSYDSEQNLLSQTDGLGNTVSWTYDGRRNKLTETNALGYTTTFSYNTLGKLLTEQDDDGVAIVTNEYAPDGNITKSTDAAGAVTSFSYNNYLAELESISDSVGVQSQFSYAKTGNAFYLASMTTASGAVTEYLRDSMGRKLAETSYRILGDGSSQALTTSYELDAKGRVVSTTDARGFKTASEYDVFDNETAMTNALGQRTEFQYDVRGNLTQTRYPDGSSENREYDAENNLITLTDRNGSVTRYQYDAANRRVLTEYADNSTEHNEYDAAGNLVAVVDGRGNRTEYQYDAAGQQVQVKDGLGNVTQYQYDKRGNRTVMIDANNQRYEYQYDAANNLVNTLNPDGTSSITSYDARGRLLTETDQAGITTQYQYDGVGRLTKVVNIAGDETTYQYDEQGNKLSQLDANGNVTRWTYDELGNVLSRTLPLGQTEYFTYDAIGNRLSHTDFNGNVSQYFYDVNNRLIRIEFADGSTEAYSFDNNGNRLSATNSEGTWTYSYDARNRLIAETQPDGSVLSYQYDVAGNKVASTVTLADASVRTEQFSFDALNRLSTVSQNNQLQMSYSYDALGNRTAELHANGNSSLYTYDALSRLLSVRHFNAGGALLNEFDYTLDATGRRLQVVEADGRLTQYGYDNLYRLISETISNSIGTEYQAQYQYDAVGNRLQQTVNGILTDYQYDANDRLQQSLSASEQVLYSYDDNGNSLSKDVNGTVTSYQYNLNNRLVQADSSMANDGVVAQYQYNVDGIRTRKVVDGNAINYLVDANQPYAQVIAETDDIGQAVKTYLYGHDLISQRSAGQTHSFHYDGLGSTRLLSDAAGNVSDSYSYAAFGELLSESGDTDNSYLFTGEQYDDSVDNYYLRARYYEQAVGRFTQMDTWQGCYGKPITLNKYIYADVDPANKIDPSGNMSIASVGVSMSINSTLRISSVIKFSGYLVAASGAVYLIENNAAENMWMLAEGTESPNVRSASDQVAYEGNRREYKNRCGEQWPGGDQWRSESRCDKWKWELRRNKDCADMRQEFSRRWFGRADARHQNAIDEMRKAASKLESKIERFCN